MSTFTFKAMDLAGMPARGEVDADSKQAVADQLKVRGLIVIDIKDKHSSRELNLDLFSRVKPSELTVMSRQLATMVSSGMTLLRALYVLEAQTEGKKLKETLVEVRKDVEAGLFFSDAIERHPKVFGPLYVAMVRAGESGGLLEDALERTADQLEKDASLRRQVKSAMVYPTVIISFAMIVLLALVAFLVPIFAKIFKDFGSKLPGLSQFTVDLSHALTSYWYIGLVLMVGLAVSFFKWKKSSWGRPQWDKFRLRIPFKIGDVVQKVALARWSRTLSALTTAGVPILQAIEITGQTAGNTVVERAMDAVLESIKSGGTIGAPLKEAPVVPGMVAHMVSVGEETGALDSMLSKVAEFYEDEVAASVKALTSILEPVMIVFVGGIVGFIVVSMYLPLFKVYDSIK
ncbi:MAG: type pilus assembly protein PilC [Solirubrobacteraceae bacterium]|jgi:type IV pilus assembly protein PilC|nr:type pilus assembly protein PilC [Solirubrobacteraceae bacterium]